MCTDCSKVDLGFSDEKFPQGTHMCYIYNDDNERKSIISKFLLAGMNNNERVAYFAHTMDKAEILGMMREEGLHVPEENTNNLVVADAGETYCPDGTFDMNRMVKNLTDFYQGTIAEGFTTARVSGEMLWVLDGKPGTEHLMEYESLGDIVLKPNPITIICQYDARKFDGATILNCLKVHPYMIVKGQIVRNPYYMSHDEYMAEIGKNGKE
jgi:hypothetical protein